ncbi:MAG: D-glycero-beta-D-manno-heptose-7-phosphate kinase [Syntrophobacterales bacterium]|nr:D-glycero-beta-D-manno-heptose-7-phosphate kinase [Syntrophobacterales bacterium]
MTSEPKKLIEAIDKFPSARILVVGDIMLDVFLWGEVHRISPEAPVPIVDIKRETYHLGGAGNVAHNISALGGKVSLCGRISDDAPGKKILGLLEEKRINGEGIVICPECPTTVKTRIIAHSQQVVRFDKEIKTPLDDRAWLKISNFIESFREYDVIVVSDYAKGVVIEPLMEQLKSLSKPIGKPLIVDPKVSNKRLYHGVTLLTPNYSEAIQMAGYHNLNPEKDLNSIASILLEELKCRFLLITRGAEGMSLFEEGRNPIHIPACARKVFDVTGAGDTVVAVLALGVAAGLPIKEAVYLANLAAGFVVGEVGTAVITPEQLKDLLKEERIKLNP